MKKKRWKQGNHHSPSHACCNRVMGQLDGLIGRWHRQSGCWNDRSSASGLTMFVGRRWSLGLSCRVAQRSLTVVGLWRRSKTPAFSGPRPRHLLWLYDDHRPPLFYLCMNSCRQTPSVRSNRQTPSTLLTYL